MSEEFIQMMLPCRECLVQAACKDKAGEGLKLNKNTSMCLALPDWDMNKKAYQKGLLECWANLGWELINSISKKENSVINVPAQFLDVFIDLLGTLQWMINCTSWNEGELYKFDSLEIERKMKNITHWLKDAK